MAPAAAARELRIGESGVVDQQVGAFDGEGEAPVRFRVAVLMIGDVAELAPLPFKHDRSARTLVR